MGMDQWPRAAHAQHSRSHDGGACVKTIDRIAADAVENMKRENSEIALQAIIELMLTDFPARAVVSKLRAWADYLEERS